MYEEIRGRRVAAITLGCKVNQYETDSMLEKLAACGASVVSFEEAADVYIVNTCSVTSIAEKKSRQMLHRARKLAPDAVVIACGCYVQSGKDLLLADASVDILVGNNRKADICEIVSKAINGELVKGSVLMEDISKEASYEPLSLSAPLEKTRAYVKVQDGCNSFCSYCIIPYARGRERSRELSEVLCEIRGFAERGIKEVVLTGINVSSYRDKQGNGLTELICGVCEVPGILRVRMSSVSPTVCTEEFVKTVSSYENFCPHFHLSLQSACNNTLKRMNRRYTIEDYREVCGLLRTYFDRPAITTDIIVGFPGETEEDFAECYANLEALSLYEMHVFKYSPRKGTVAAGMKDQLTDKEKTARSEVLLHLTRKQAECYRNLFIGEKLRVLWEDEEEIKGKRYMIGHTDRYVRVAVPENQIDKYGAHSGEITTVSPSAFINADTLLI